MAFQAIEFQAAEDIDHVLEAAAGVIEILIEHHATDSASRAALCGAFALLGDARERIGISAE